MQQSQREALEARALSALERLYHLATPAYPTDFGPYAADFDSFVSEQGAADIEWLNDGAGYGRNYAATLAAPCNAGRFASEWARRYYVAKGMRTMRRDLDARPYAQTVEMFGNLYTWGRGGRTVAPDGLIRQRGGSSFGMKRDAFEEMSAERLTQAVRVVEAFGDFVERWNKGIPEMWAEHTADRAANESGEARDALRLARDGARALLADIREMRRASVQAPAVCATLRAELARLRREMREAFATAARLAPVLQTAEA